MLPTAGSLCAILAGGMLLTTMSAKVVVSNIWTTVCTISYIKLYYLLIINIILVMDKPQCYYLLLL